MLPLDLDKKDLEALATFIHIDKGIRVTCFNDASIKDVVIKPENILSETLHNWGNEWGSGEPIESSFADLIDNLLYPIKYKNYEPIFNPYQIENFENGNEYAFYDKCISVLYYYGGTDENQRNDMSGLKLIYQENLDEWYLTGIIHCENIK